MDTTMLKNHRTALTLVELLVVIAIIGVLVALLLPAIQAAREAARRTQCLNNLKQVGLAVMNFESAKKTLPKGDWRQKTSATGIDSLGTWVTETMPFMEIGNLFNEMDFTKPYFEQGFIGPDKTPTHHFILESHICPSNGPVGIVTWNNGLYGARGNYAANAGFTDPEEECGLWMDDLNWEQVGKDGRGYPNCTTGQLVANPVAGAARPEVKSAMSGFGPFLVNRGIALREATDGTSNTVAISEVRTVEGDDTRGALHWGGGVMYLHSLTPNNRGVIQQLKDRTRLCVDEPEAPCFQSSSGWQGWHRNTARSAHSGGVNTLFLDSSVRFVSNDVDLLVWRAASTFDGGEILNGEL